MDDPFQCFCHRSKMRNNVHLCTSSDNLLSNLYSCMHEKYVYMADEQLRELDFSAKLAGCQWALGTHTIAKNVHSKDDAWHFQKKTKVNDSHTLQVPCVSVSTTVAMRQGLLLAGLGCVLLQTYIAKFNEDTSYSCSTLIPK